MQVADPDNASSEWAHAPVVVLDYGAGNLASFEGALQRLNIAFIRVQDAREWPAEGVVVLPGVGHFRSAKAALTARGLWALLLGLAPARPLLGVCLGMQLMGEGSEEAPGEAGLGYLAGCAKHLRSQLQVHSSLLKVPHMGWNELAATSRHALAAHAPHWAYFVHSYALPVTPQTVASCTYGAAFAATSANGLRVGMQHHPEKSSAQGLRSLQHALTWLATASLDEQSDRPTAEQIGTEQSTCS
jgi:imidazole glycerol-phosphate synthase subunit HisH